MGNRRGTHAHRCSDIADAFLGMAQEPEDAESCAVTEHGKNVRSHEKLLLRRDGRHKVCEVAAMVMEMFTHYLFLLCFLKGLISDSCAISTAMPAWNLIQQSRKRLRLQKSPTTYSIFQLH